MGIATEPAKLPVTVIMEGLYVEENLSKIPDITKERLTEFLTKHSLTPNDVLMMLVAGNNVFLQPYSGDYMTDTIDPQDEGTL